MLGTTSGRSCRLLQPQLPYRSLGEVLQRISAESFRHAYDNATWCFVVQRTLANITPESRLIRIHNVLNGPDVPDDVFDTLIFHEMLHLEIPPIRRRSGSWDTHPPAFREAERLRSPKYDDSWTWLHANVPLRRRPRLQCTDVVPKVLRLTSEQRAWARERFGVALPSALRSDEPSSRRISVDMWSIAIAARHQPNAIVSGDLDAPRQPRETK